MDSLSLRVFLCSSLLCALPFSSQAQYGSDNRAVMERMDRLERDLMMTQRQLARGGPVSRSSINGDADDAPPSAAAAQAEVRVSAMEEELRALRGKVEESDFQIKRLNEQFEKMQKDVDFRFGELSSAPQAPAGAAKDLGVQESARNAVKQVKDLGGQLTDLEAASVPPAEGEPSDIKTMEDKKKLLLNGSASKSQAVTSAGSGVLAPPKAADPKTGEPPLDQPRDLYNSAFRLLNQTRYDDAAKQFKLFIEKFPNDPLIGNAYYWLGETSYIKRDYPQAADRFRRGFEILPSGPKAADNLLKLAMTLSAMKRDTDACTVLEQVLARFKNSSSALLKKAENERTRIGCK